MTTQRQWVINGQPRGRALVEAAQHARLTPRVAVHLQKRQEGQSREVRDLAFRAQQRLHARHRALAAHRKKGCVIVAALARELWEELGIQIGRTSPLLEIRHDYGDKCVLLDVHVVWEFSGEARGLEAQPLSWVEPEALEQYRFPAANVPIIGAINALLAKTERGN